MNKPWSPILFKTKMGHPTLRKLVRKFLLKNSKETSRFCRTKIRHREASLWGLDGSGGVRIGERGGREGGKRRPPPDPVSYVSVPVHVRVRDRYLNRYLFRSQDEGFWSRARGHRVGRPNPPPQNLRKIDLFSPTHTFYKTSITDRGRHN